MNHTQPMNHTQHIQAMTAQRAALISRRDAAISSLDDIGTREKSAWLAARARLADALASENEKAIKAANNEVEASKREMESTSAEEDRFSLLAEGLIAKIEAANKEIEAAQSERAEALRVALSERAMSAAIEYHEHLEACRAAFVVMQAINPLLKYNADLPEVIYGASDARMPGYPQRLDLADMPQFRRDNPMSIPSHEVENARDAVVLDLRAMGVME